MSLLIPPGLVDALPEKLWWLGNIYRLFGHDMHFCTGGSRTIELDGAEIGRGSRPFVDFVEEPSSWSVSGEELQALSDLVETIRSGLGVAAGLPKHLASLTGDRVPFEVAPERRSPTLTER